MRDDLRRLHEKEQRSCFQKVSISRALKLPVGSFVHKSFEGKSRVISETQLHAVVEYNLTVWKKLCLIRFNYARYVNKVWKVFFGILLLSYPSISTRVLRVYACVEMGSTHVMAYDNQVDCKTRRYAVFATLGLAVMVFFVFGVPALFLILIQRARNKNVNYTWLRAKDIPKRKEALLREAKEDAKIQREFWALDKDGDGTYTLKEEEFAIKKFLRRKNMRHHDALDKYGFIYDAYREDAWYYEIVEISRKLMLNGFVVLVPGGICTRVVFGFLVSFVYLIILNAVKPYRTTSDHLLQLIAHMQIFTTMFAGMLIKAEVKWLGFAEHLRPVEGHIATWTIILSHATVSGIGVLMIVTEKFWSSEIKRLRAQRKKNANLLKQRMAKWKRAKKKLMGRVKADKVFSTNLGLGSGGGTDALFKSLALGSGETNHSTKANGKSSYSRKPTSVGPAAATHDFAWPGAS